MRGLLRKLMFARWKPSGGSRRAHSRTAIQFESLERKTLCTTLTSTPAAIPQTEVARTAADSRNPLNQLSFLIGRWNAQEVFPNGAARPELQVLNYRFNRNRSAILLNQVVRLAPGSM
jgi:hypothetical protein